jgi:uncharacterized heparinase superfamily protein
LDLGQSLLAAEIKEQVLPDGMHYELSPAYHLQVFADVLECVPLVEGRLEDDLRAVLSRMAEASVDLTHPDGAPSLFNDGGLHMAYPPEECLSVARSLGVSVPAPRHCFAFGSAGYFGRRDHGEYLLVDCGALGPDHLPAHGHGDALSFEWSIAGRRFIVDAGVLEYERGEWRYASRATVSHNTLTLDDADQHEFWAAFRVGRRARVTLERFEPGPEGFELEGCHDGFRKLGGSPLHRRHFVASRGRLQVTDEVRGGAGQCARARILLHPEVVAQVSGDHWTFRQGAETVALRTSGTVALEDAWWFPDFGIRTSTRRIVIDYGPAPSRGTFDLQRIGRS